MPTYQEALKLLNDAYSAGDPVLSCAATKEVGHE
jgi:hypothetical protein